MNWAPPEIATAAILAIAQAPAAPTPTVHTVVTAKMRFGTLPKTFAPAT